MKCRICILLCPMLLRYSLFDSNILRSFLLCCGKGSPLSSLKKNLPLYFTIEQVSSMVIEYGIRAKPFGRTRIINDGHVANLPTRPLPETD